MTAVVLRGDARALPLADNSVDLIVTSPPYWSLRSYTDDGEHYAGQIGSEEQSGQYIDNLIGCTREWMRLLKPSGSIWVNLGDKYSSPGGHTDNTASTRLQGRPNLRKQGRPDRSTSDHGVAAKSLFGLPWRYALRCIGGGGNALADPAVVTALLRDVACGVLTLAEAEALTHELAAVPDEGLGLILRAEVVWSKPNAMPESCTDRLRRSHEQWFHFTKSPRYFSAVDAIRLPASDYSRPNKATRSTPGGQRPRAMADTCNPLGALPGSVWEVATEPLQVPAHLGVDHFAAFPMEWPRRIILGWSPSGICTACGEGRRPVADRDLTVNRGGRQSQRGISAVGGGKTGQSLGHERVVTITGEVCGCSDTAAPTRPAVVVDPFGGTGTTALVADALGRVGLSFDRSADYCRLARWRTSDPGQIAKAMQVEKPPAQLDGQGDLFAELGGVAS